MKRLDVWIRKFSCRKFTKTKRAAWLTVLCLTIFCSNSDATPVNRRNAKGQKTGRVLMMQLWSVPDGSSEGRSVELEARIIEREAAIHEGILQIFEDRKLIFSDDVSLFPESLFTLDDDNLATLWSHPNGAWTLIVYTFKNHKVKIALEGFGGKLRPEFVYPSKGHIYGYADTDGKPRIIRGGPYYRQRILIPDTDWIMLKKPYVGRTSDLQPVTVDIYTWNESKGNYDAKLKVPWNQRLQNLGGSF